jgi:hypothetical protein
VSEDGTSALRYVYFNVTDEELSKTHADYPKDNPCVETKDNYYVRQGLLFDAYNAAARSEMAAKLAVSMAVGRLGLEVKFTSKAVYREAVTSLFDKQSGQVYRILQNALASLSKEAAVKQDEIAYITNDTFYIVNIIALPEA